MQWETDRHNAHGLVYRLMRFETGYLVTRQDPDHRRTVCVLDTEDQWRKFCAALDSGKPEEKAVHAVDG